MLRCKVELGISVRMNTFEMFRYYNWNISSFYRTLLVSSTIWLIRTTKSFQSQFLFVLNSFHIRSSLFLSLRFSTVNISSSKSSSPSPSKSAAFYKKHQRKKNIERFLVAKKKDRYRTFIISSIFTNVADSFSPDTLAMACCNSFT